MKPFQIPAEKTDTAQRAKAEISAVLALGEAIRDLGEVPSGHLYAHVMSFMSLSFYESAIGILVESKLITKQYDLLKWVGTK